MGPLSLTSVMETVNKAVAERGAVFELSVATTVNWKLGSFSKSKAREFVTSPESLSILKSDDGD